MFDQRMFPLGCKVKGYTDYGVVIWGGRRQFHVRIRQIVNRSLL